MGTKAGQGCHGRIALAVFDAAYLALSDARARSELNLRDLLALASLEDLIGKTEVSNVLVELPQLFRIGSVAILLDIVFERASLAHVVSFLAPVWVISHIASRLPVDFTAGSYETPPAV